VTFLPKMTERGAGRREHKTRKPLPSSKSASSLHPVRVELLRASTSKRG
jgi:hypothetical protein